jgi:hypothetical protein
MLKLKPVSLLAFGNFKHYSEVSGCCLWVVIETVARFPNYLILKTELSMIYSP